MDALLRLIVCAAVAGCTSARATAPPDQSLEILRAAIAERVDARTSLRSIGTFRLDTIAVAAEWGVDAGGEAIALLGFAYDGNPPGGTLPAGLTDGLDVSPGNRESAHVCEGWACRLEDTGYFLQLTLPRLSRHGAAVGYVERWPQVAQTGTLYLVRRGRDWVVARNRVGASAH